MQLNILETNNEIWLFMPVYVFYYLARYREKSKSLLTFVHLDMLLKQAHYPSPPASFILLLKLALPPLS